MKTLDTLLAESPIFRERTPEHLAIIAGCATNVRFNAGEYIFREGDASKHFYLLRAGRVALEVNAPGRGPFIIQTLEEGELLGWSSLVHPFKHQFDARAMELTRAFAFDGPCVRDKSEEDPRFGYALLKHFSAVVRQRLQATRMQLMDLYGTNR